MAEKIFPTGFRFERPNEKCPEWIKGKISIKVDEFIPFLQEYRNDRGYINIDLKMSKDKKLYCELNTFKLDPNAFKPEQKVEPTEEIKVDDIPFN